MRYADGAQLASHIWFIFECTDVTIMQRHHHVYTHDNALQRKTQSSFVNSAIMFVNKYTRSSFSSYRHCALNRGVFCNSGNI